MREKLIPEIRIIIPIAGKKFITALPVQHYFNSVFFCQPHHTVLCKRAGRPQRHILRKDQVAQVFHQLFLVRKYTLPQCSRMLYYRLSVVAFIKLFFMKRCRKCFQPVTYVERNTLFKQMINNSCYHRTVHASAKANTHRHIGAHAVRHRLNQFIAHPGTIFSGLNFVII